MIKACVHRRLRVVAGVEATACALHDPAVRIGEIVLRCGLGHTELALVASARGLAFFVARLAFVVGAAATFDVGVALTPLDTLACLGDGLEPILTALDLRRGVYFGLIVLWRLALTLILVPSMATLAGLISPISCASLTTCTNRSANCFRCSARKSRIVRCLGKLPACCVRGFTNGDFRSQLTKTRWWRSCADDPKKASAKVGRCVRRLHASACTRLIAKAAKHIADRAPLLIRDTATHVYLLKIGLSDGRSFARMRALAIDALTRSIADESFLYEAVTIARLPKCVVTSTRWPISLKAWIAERASGAVTRWSAVARQTSGNLY